MCRSAPFPVPASYKAARPHAPRLSNLIITDTGAGTAWDIAADVQIVPSAGWPLLPYPQVNAFVDLWVNGSTRNSGPLNTNLTYLFWGSMAGTSGMGVNVYLTIKTPMGNSATSAISGSMSGA